jgi:hypothetical protein
MPHGLRRELFSLRRGSGRRRNTAGHYSRGRQPVVCRARQRLVRVGPGRARQTQSWDIDWKPEHLSASFHGRDLFAPVAAMLARGEPPPRRPRKDRADCREDWPDDLSEIVYVDRFGNAMTGLRAAMLPRHARLAAAGRVLERARTFGDQQPGSAFWYENSNGLAEIAVNQGRADRELGLSIGAQVDIVPLNEGRVHHSFLTRCANSSGNGSLEAEKAPRFAAGDR